MTGFVVFCAASAAFIFIVMIRFLVYGIITRANLEWLVYHTLKSESPCITISRGRELLGFDDMQKMREWMKNYEP